MKLIKRVNNDGDPNHWHEGDIVSMELRNPETGVISEGTYRVTFSALGSMDVIPVAAEPIIYKVCSNVATCGHDAEQEGETCDSCGAPLKVVDFDADMTINIYNVPQDQDRCDTPDKPGVVPDWTGTREEFIKANIEAEDLVELVGDMEDGDAAYYGGGAAPLVWIQAVAVEVKA